MGQYHLPVNLTKREYLDPNKLGDGLKAWEQCASSAGGTASALILLLTCPATRGGGDFTENAFAGRWHGDRVLLVGDYAEPGDFEVPAGYPPADRIYGLCYEDVDLHELVKFAPNHVFTDITAEVGAVLADELEICYCQHEYGGVTRVQPGERLSPNGPHTALAPAVPGYYGQPRDATADT